MEIDTAYFTGNNAPRISIQGANIEHSERFAMKLPGAWKRLADRDGLGVRGSAATKEDIEQAEKACSEASSDWFDVLPMTPLNPGYAKTRKHLFSSSLSSAKKPVTHVRINYFPDGGVARLRLFGSVSLNYDRDLHGKVLDLACASHGGRGIAWSNNHFGEPADLLKPTRGINMSDGWETARHSCRPPILQRNPKSGLVDYDLKDWCIIKLGAVAESVEKILIDTAHFRGNYPESVIVEGCCKPSVSDEFVSHVPGMDSAVGWFPLLDRTKLGPDAEHEFVRVKESTAGRPLIRCDAGKVSHVRVSIFPDGGLSRVRVYGKAVEPVLSSNVGSVEIIVNKTVYEIVKRCY